MLMLALEWMGMYNDNTIHHIRVGKQRNSSQIGKMCIRDSPLSTAGYYLDKRLTFTFDPLFHAGCYYVQEASSMRCV